MKSRALRMLVVAVAIALLFGLILGNGTANAQEKKYPAKAIEVVVNFPPGGPVDLPGRIITTELAKELGVPMTLDNKAGAGAL